MWLRRMSLAVLKYTADHIDKGLGQVPMACKNDSIAGAERWGDALRDMEWLKKE